MLRVQYTGALVLPLCLGSTIRISVERGKPLCPHRKVAVVTVVVHLLCAAPTCVMSASQHFFQLLVHWNSIMSQ